LKITDRVVEYFCDHPVFQSVAAQKVYRPGCTRLVAGTLSLAIAVSANDTRAQQCRPGILSI